VFPEAAADDHGGPRRQRQARDTAAATVPNPGQKFRLPRPASTAAIPKKVGGVGGSLPLHPAVDQAFCKLRSLAVLLGLVAAGCGRDAQMPPSFPVSGTVTVAGAPLVEGSISFEPADGQGGVYGGLIRDGRFAVEVAAGAKRVSILGMKQLGEIGPDGKPMASQFLPRRYNTDTELTASIEPRENALSFELTVEPSARSR